MTDDKKLVPELCPTTTIPEKKRESGGASWMQIRRGITCRLGIEGWSPDRTATRIRRMYELGYLGALDGMNGGDWPGLGHKSCSTKNCHAVGGLQKGTRAKTD